MTTGQRWRQLTLTLQEYAEKGRERGFYKRKKPCTRDWSAYDQAQIHEACDVLDSIRLVVDQACLDMAPYLERSRGPGRPADAGGKADLAKAVLVQQYMALANRRLEGCLRLFSEKLGLLGCVGYKGVERAYGDPDVAVILLAFFDLTLQGVRDESVFAVDSTGLSTSIKDNWESYLVGKRRYSVFEKIVCVVGHRYGLVSAFKTLDSMHEGECPAFRPLLGEVAARHDRVELFCGDSAYLSRENCALVEALGGVPRFYPKKNTSLRSFGCKAWQDMLLSFIDDSQAWLEEYHHRYVCESAFSALKRRCLAPLRRRTESRRKLEVVARICVYNLIRLSYARWTKNLQAPTKPKPK
jgi:transposase